ncbi:MAG: NADH-quinone oxidoreductase subunit NuoE [Nitrospirota bacterium]
MLTEQERQEIEAEVGQYANRRAACIDALKILQRHRGWVSDEGIRDLSCMLGMTPEELDSVATFYNLIFRKPVGRHIVLLCNTISCWIMGYEGIFNHVSGRLGIGFGQTTEDGRFTLLPIPCLGACDRAPAMMIDDELYTDLTPERIDALLSTYRSDGT